MEASPRRSSTPYQSDQTLAQASPGSSSSRSRHTVQQYGSVVLVVSILEYGMVVILQHDIITTVRRSYRSIAVFYLYFEATPHQTNVKCADTEYGGTTYGLTVPVHKLATDSGAGLPFAGR